jgi:hypothetical protein
VRQPLRVTFRHLPPSREVASLAKKYAEKIDGLGGRLTACQVVVELPHRNRRKGRQYRVRVVCAVPGKRFTAAAGHTVLQVAVADAFRAARQTIIGGRRRSRTRRSTASRWPAAARQVGR